MLGNNMRILVRCAHKIRYTRHLQTHGICSWSSNAQPPELPSQSMYSIACSEFVKSVGKGTLLPVPSIDHTDDVKLFQLVVKTRKKWLYFFEKVEFKPTEFRVTDVMIDNSRLRALPQSSDMVIDYNKTSKVALKGKIGANIAKNILGVSLNVKDSMMIDVSFGTVRKQELDEPALLTELGERWINLNHPYIRQIREDETKTLCVVTAVSDLKNGGVIKRKTGTDLSASATATVIKKVSLTGGTEFSKEREIILPTNTPVAYRVHELFVDKDRGSMELVLTAGTNGGFVSNIGSDVVIQRHAKPAIDERKLLEDYREIISLPGGDRQRFTQTIKNLMAVPRDLCILADIIDIQMLKTNSIEQLENQMLLPKDKWLTLMLFSGFSAKDDCVEPPPEMTSLFRCVSDLLDTLTVLEDDMLELLQFCDKHTADCLMDVLLAVMRSSHMTDKQKIEAIMKDTVAMEILQALNFDIHKLIISPPPELPATIDEIYIVLFVLFG